MTAVHVFVTAACVCVCGWMPVCTEPVVALRKEVQIIVATVAPAMPCLTEVPL